MQQGFNFGAIIYEIKRLLAGHQNYKVCFVRRNANEAAHRLASRALLLERNRL